MQRYNNINISGNNQKFSYVLEYNNESSYTANDTISWFKTNDKQETIYLSDSNSNVYRKRNDWYNYDDSIMLSVQNIPNSIRKTNIKVYLPEHSVSAYAKNIKYALTLCTWINGVKIDLGSFIFGPNNSLANDFGSLKIGNNEYHEYMQFDIIDPFDIVYSDAWSDFRLNVCGEPTGINNTGSLLYATLYVVESYDNRYIMKNNWVGGATMFNISKPQDMMSLNINTSVDILGFEYTLTVNNVYNDLLNYLSETYGLNNISQNNLFFELVLKSKDSVIPGPRIPYSSNALKESKIDRYQLEENNYIKKLLSWHFIKANSNNPDYKLIYEFFNSWDNFSEGWNIVGSFIVNIDGEDVLTLISNELPISQNVFSIFTNNGTRKIIDIKDMNKLYPYLHTYNVINKNVTEVIQVERPNDSKANIVQPTFFKVNDLELITLHPEVTENICINLDDYKSKVERFILKIGDCKFNQIGANKYGILFKIVGNKLPSDIVSGTYYILNEDYELVTTGKYNCVR